MLHEFLLARMPHGFSLLDFGCGDAERMHGLLPRQLEQARRGGCRAERAVRPCRMPAEVPALGVDLAEGVAVGHRVADFVTGGVGD